MQPTPSHAHQPGVVIGTFTDYRDAQRLVDRLSDQGFPVQHVRIVGRGLHSVEQVVGRMTTVRAALGGLVSGALLGALFGLLLGLFVDDTSWWAPMLVGAIFGALWGALSGFLAHRMTGGERDFVSSESVRADTYEVQVDDEHAERARQIAGTAATSA